MAPELVSLLNSYSVPAGLCDNQGKWVALNGKLQKILAESFCNNLSGYLASENAWQDVHKAISRNCQICLTGTHFKAPLEEKFAQVTPIEILGANGAIYLIEFFCRSERTRTPMQPPLQRREVEWEARRTITRKRNAQRAATESRRDTLTGLPGKLAFEHQLSHQWNLALCQRTSLSLLLIAVEFPRPQDGALERARADTALQRIAICLQDNLGRWNDFAARSGDKSFAVILPGTDRRGATAMAERLLETVSALDIAEATATAHEPVALAIGSHSLRPTPAASATALVSGAESALHRARESGRNCALAYSLVEASREPAI